MRNEQHVCAVTVPAPGMMLVFLTDDSFNAVTPNPANTITFPTSVVSKTVCACKQQCNSGTYFQFFSWQKNYVTVTNNC